jgi:hypothetical protein
MSLGLAAELVSLEELLEVRRGDFSAFYLAVCELHTFVETYPEVVRIETVSLLKKTLHATDHLRQKQSLVLYRKVADTLASLVILPDVAQYVAKQAMESLQRALASPTTNPKRAAAEALGSLPIRIRGPELPPTRVENAPRLRWEEVLSRCNAANGHTPTLMGRSIVVPRRVQDDLLVIKLARIQDDPSAMHQEACWMQRLRAADGTVPMRFDIPNPIGTADQYLFRLENPPLNHRTLKDLHPDRYGIGFTAHRDYFRYINGPASETGLNLAGFMEALFRNAWLLGKLAAMGIVHAAPIPLFHNRLQRHRRSDLGLYDWPRGGRLDQWLYSCRYPNLGLSGLRDFEHFVAFQGPSHKLYQLIGTHLFSLMLLAGSYFRNQDPRKMGLDEHGQPVDARDLFDRETLKRLLEGILSNYYHGFVGIEFSDRMPHDLDTLATRMIDEMGVDRHMEEILRIADQEAMTDEEFLEFLMKRGCSPQDAERRKRGANDLVIHSGPHLGAFNNRISLPELIDLVAIASALCVAGRYVNSKSLK